MEHDSQLVADSLVGNRDSFGRIYDRYAQLVRAVCFETTGSLADSNDLSQEVFVRAWANLRQIDNPQRLGQWLTGIARNVSLEWIRRQKRTRRGHEQLAIQVSRSSGTFVDEQKQERLTTLFGMLQRLSEQERQAVHLHYLLEQPAERAKSVLGLSTSGFYRVLERARAKLRELIRVFEEAEK